MKKVRNERGSATIEFLAMVPLVLLILMIFIQFLVAGYAVMVAQSAVNEAAKVYSTSEDLDKANIAASDVLASAGGNLNFNGVVESSRENNNFELTLNVDLRLIFIPEKYTGSMPDISFAKSINGRVMK
ncbi:MULTISPECIES: TadE/TadG family type IV pilus assembly protein [Bacillaceae]|uniref:TadE/TadG family type IV pilus assembly protein n=1 Tax=Bacillaceae TaxID=186817 RepID=UPI002964F4EB|nr:pilus assembly protein [Bacillus infantis]MDW2879571.1 pilus assembly protein [Bacillus infantis]